MLVLQAGKGELSRSTTLSKLPDSRDHLRPRLPAVCGLVQELRRVNRPALRRRSKVEYGNICTEFDSVMRPVLSPIAGAVHRAIDIVITDIKAIADDPAVQRVDKIDGPGNG